MTIRDALIAGVVQGLTEFLPVSSSGHLALLQHLPGWPDPERNLGFNVALHFASMLAVVFFVAPELRALLRGRGRLLVVAGAATVPLAAAGLLGRALVVHVAGDLVLVGACFLFTASLLMWTRRLPEGGASFAGMSLGRALGVGAGQAVGILPGVSRSGATLTACLAAGLERGQAVRFTFLLAVPAILGATAVQGLRDGFFAPGIPAAPLLAGMASAFVASLAGMKAVAVVTARRGLCWFAPYCAGLGVVSIALGAAG
ncbi:MAG: undecaprenyl-diphosphate phosphatase [Planctomycetota bacterium]